jgi:glycine/D-amino acid oxidase-like deaminating enzyme
MRTTDIIVVGGGNIGSAVAYGIAAQGAAVTVLDEGDVALRAARGNFGLVWFQGKGLGMQRYVDWCLEATRQWPEFARILEASTGVSIDYRKPGGLYLCRGEAGYTARVQTLEQLRRQSGSDRYDCEMLDRSDLQQLIPHLALGPAICGGSYSPHDGHVNPLYLIRALHKAFQQAGGRYCPGQAVVDVQPDGGEFVVQTPRERFRAPKLVLACGLGIPKLAARLGMQMPVRPQRGQLLVTERVRPVLPYPISGIRQTEEGSFMLGVSNEEVGYDVGVTTDVLRSIAQQAIEALPALAEVRIVRSWGALRPLTPDHFPIYHQCEHHPGAFVATSHSGVSLASLCATHIARWITEGIEPDGFDRFSPRRFDV